MKEPNPQVTGPEMFSDLTRQELQALFATLGSGAFAGRGNYGVYSELAEVQTDVHQALGDVTRAEFAARPVRAEKLARDAELQAEAEMEAGT